MAFDENKDDGGQIHVAGKKNGESLIEAFIQSQSKDQYNVPPIRVLVVGDDKEFNHFLAEYVSLLELGQSD